MVNERLKDFWKNEINTLSTTHGVAPDDADWATNLDKLHKWAEIGDKGRDICKNIYTKANQPIPADIPDKSKNYETLLAEGYKDLELEILDLANVCQNKLGIDPLDRTVITQNNQNVPKWKADISQKLPNNKTKLTDIPQGMDLADLLYRNRLYVEITSPIGLPDLISQNLTGSDRVNAYGFYWPNKVNTTAILNYRGVDNSLRTLLGLAPTDNIPNDWDTKLVSQDDYNILEAYHNDLLATLGYTATQNDYDPTNTWQDLKTNRLGINTLNDIPAGKTLTDLFTACPLAHCSNPTHHTNYNTVKGESDEYQRIHTKLNGKVSDSELDTLLTGSPTCSHTDYDAIKAERDQLKGHKCDCDSKVAAKETEIINKIITDLSLTTERERERECFRSGNHGN